MNNIIKFTDEDMFDLAECIDELCMGLQYNIIYRDNYTESHNGEEEVQEHYKERVVEWLNLPRVFTNDELQEQLEQALTAYYDKYKLFEQ